MVSDVPHLDGVHHLKLPVSDIEVALAWYCSRLGYVAVRRWVEHGRLMGVGMTHPHGGPGLALRLQPDRAAKAAGFDYFSIGVPTRAELAELADRLTELGDEHGGVRLGLTGWVLPYLHDPDGHELRFYTTEQHTDSNDPSIRVLTEAHGWADQREHDLDRPTPGAQ